MQKVYEFLDIFEFSDELAQKDEKMQSELEKFDIAYLDRSCIAVAGSSCMGQQAGAY